MRSPLPSLVAACILVLGCGSDPVVSTGGGDHTVPATAQAVTFTRPEKMSAMTSPRAKFTLVVMPDTQATIFKCPAGTLQQETKWIADNVAPRNIRFVLHVGDIQESPAMPGYYQTARESMTLLDGRVPYAIAIGNHDLDKWGGPAPHAAIAADRSSTIFNEYFPLSHFVWLPSFGGSFPEGTNDNSFHLFSAGGTDWLAIAFKFRPIDAELAWANSVASAFPTRRVMVVTHDYLSPDGIRTTAGETMWQALIRKHANMSFVFSGHLWAAARRVDVGDAGNPVYQILSDYQNYADCEPNTYLRLLEFEPASGRVAVQTYSPPLDRFMTGDDHQFTLIDVPFGLPAPGP